MSHPPAQGPKPPPPPGIGSTPGPAGSGSPGAGSGQVMYNESELAAGKPRPHWEQLWTSLQQLGPQELAARWDNGRRLIREHGVTYNVHGDPQGLARPWALDLIPMLLPAAEWAGIETGLQQRSRLFNLILADIYGGGQRLLRDGFIPPEVVYANPGFLRACRGIPVPRQAYVHLLASDLGRSVDGKWWVLADRAQAPSGSGYALENRTVLSRILPDELRDGHVRRLASFFRTQREMLVSLAPQGRANPSVVLLTPGPHNESYFEHAYLARHLGFPLVEGGDLTVRDRSVFLKTLEGLQPVDVILRRVHDSYCDPLELRSDSLLGIPGLVEAMRAGTLTLANALGTGLLETPALLAFLPGLCRHLLGEELILPSVATWWCGQARELHYVLEHLDALVVRPAFGGSSRAPWAEESRTAAERARLAEAIRARPRDFVGQERMQVSCAPAWVGNQLEPRPVVVRAFVASAGETCAVLPGALTLYARSPGGDVGSILGGGGSKDTWVQADGDVDEGTALVANTETRLLERSLSGVPSRVADNLFWLGRYTERLEQVLRVLRCLLGRLSGDGAEEGSAELAALAGLLANLDYLKAAANPDASVVELQAEALELLYQPDRPGGVPELLGRIRNIASAVRDRFSGDTWRILGRLDLDARVRPGRLATTSALTLIHNLILDLAAFSGMEMENMTRGYGWRFLDLGRRLERGLNVVGLLRASLLATPHPGVLLEPVLEIADSLMTYRRRYFAAVQLPGVIELLLREELNPRSLAFQLEIVREHLRELPQGEEPTASSQEGWPLVALAGATDLTDMTLLLDAATSGDGVDDGALIRRMGALAEVMGALSEDITHRYFSHTLPRTT